MGGFEERANFSTWVHRIAVNCSLDLLRSRNRHEKNEMSTNQNDDDDPPNELASNDPQPDRLLLSRELQERVGAAMESLSGNERTAFVLRHFDGMPVDEIGKTLGIQVNAAKHTIFRAVRKLRASLEPLVRTNPSCST
jgi:RNA polymerase sigma-70 factor (ECF subfamily)